MRIFGFLKNDINRLCLEFKNKTKEKNDDCLDYIKNEEKSVIEKVMNK